MKGYLFIELKNPGTEYEYYQITGSRRSSDSYSDTYFSIYDGRTRNEPVENWVVGSSYSINSIEGMVIMQKLMELALSYKDRINKGQQIKPQTVVFDLTSNSYIKENL
jgi:hypothetical protein